MSRLALLLVIALLAIACGSGEPGGATTTTTSLAVTTSVALSTTTFADPGSTAAVTSTTTAPAPARYELVNGAFQGPEMFVVMLGDTFVIEVVSDAAGELHIHGFDLLFELVADEPTRVEFVASGPGVFEVELEGSHTHLFDIEVRD